LVKINTPTIIRSIPLIISKFLRIEVVKGSFLIRSTKKTVAIIGIAMPREKRLRSKIPWLRVFCVAAYASIPASIGPTQGVQPNENAIPARNDQPKPIDFFWN
jgi:hypothetical protein